MPTDSHSQKLYLLTIAVKTSSITPMRSTSNAFVCVLQFHEQLASKTSLNLHKGQFVRSLPQWSDLPSSKNLRLCSSILTEALASYQRAHNFNMHRSHDLLLFSFFGHNLFNVLRLPSHRFLHLLEFSSVNNYLISLYYTWYLWLWHLPQGFYRCLSVMSGSTATSAFGILLPRITYLPFFGNTLSRMICSNISILQNLQL